jgi:hypothetical protein
MVPSRLSTQPVPPPVRPHASYHPAPAPPNSEA